MINIDKINLNIDINNEDINKNLLIVLKYYFYIHVTCKNIQFFTQYIQNNNFTTIIIMVKIKCLNGLH